MKAQDIKRELTGKGLKRGYNGEMIFAQAFF